MWAPRVGSRARVCVDKKGEGWNGGSGVSGGAVVGEGEGGGYRIGVRYDEGGV